MWRGMLAGVLVLLASCTARDTGPETAPNALAIGDSVLAWNSFGGRAIPDVVARETGLRFFNASVSGARISHPSEAARAKGGDIRGQLEDGPWSWVLINGGANDLLFECGCRGCAQSLSRMISADGTRGDIPELVTRARGGGARVIMLGYYDGNARPNLFSRCSSDVAALNARLQRLAARRDGVYFVSAAPAMDPANPRHWAIDRVHPSQLGSERIGAVIAARICVLEGRAKCRNRG